MDCTTWYDMFLRYFEISIEANKQIDAASRLEKAWKREGLGCAGCRGWWSTNLCLARQGCLCTRGLREIYRFIAVAWCSNMFKLFDSSSHGDGEANGISYAFQGSLCFVWGGAVSGFQEALVFSLHQDSRSQPPCLAQTSMLKRPSHLPSQSTDVHPGHT